MTALGQTLTATGTDEVGVLRGAGEGYVTLASLGLVIAADAGFQAAIAAQDEYVAGMAFDAAGTTLTVTFTNGAAPINVAMPASLTTDLFGPSADAANLLVTGSDNLSYLDAAAVAAVMTTPAVAAAIAANDDDVSAVAASVTATDLQIDVTEGGATQSGTVPLATLAGAFPAGSIPATALASGAADTDVSNVAVAIVGAAMEVAVTEDGTLYTGSIPLATLFAAAPAGSIPASALPASAADTDVSAAALAVTATDLEVSVTEDGAAVTGGVPLTSLFGAAPAGSIPAAAIAGSTTSSDSASLGVEKVGSDFRMDIDSLPVSAAVDPNVDEIAKNDVAAGNVDERITIDAAVAAALTSGTATQAAAAMLATDIPVYDGTATDDFGGVAPTGPTPTLYKDATTGDLMCWDATAAPAAYAPVGGSSDYPYLTADLGGVAPTSDIGPYWDDTTSPPQLMIWDALATPPAYAATGGGGAVPEAVPGCPGAVAPSAIVGAEGGGNAATNWGSGTALTAGELAALTDGDTATSAYTPTFTGTSSISYFTVDFGAPVVASELTLLAPSTGFNFGGTLSVGTYNGTNAVHGSNDGTTWVLLDVSSYIDDGTQLKHVFDHAANGCTAYQYYRKAFNRSTPSSETYDISEVEFT